MADFAPLANSEDWEQFKDKLDLLNDLALHLGSEFEFLHTTRPGERFGINVTVARFQHIPSGVLLNLVPGGEFEYGLSEPEQEALDEIGMELLDGVFIRPTQRCRVESFLVGVKPLQAPNVSKYLEATDSIDRMYDWTFAGFPFLLQQYEANEWCKKSGFSLPSEVQREYYCRALTTTPFYTGRSVPAHQELEFGICGSNLDDKRAEIYANPFGLVGLGICEWCSDILAGASESEVCQAVRGGAAELWPWQGVEEAEYALSSFRRSSQQLEFKPHVAGVRPVLPL